MSLAPNNSESPGRLLALDGFRGMAIALVLLCHFSPDYLMPNAGLEWLKKACQAGWVGVDAFFVLSGFLITRILLRLKDQPGRERTFYTNRALRILPLYVVALVGIFIILPWFIPPNSAPSFDVVRQNQLWHWLCSSNIIMLTDGLDAMNSTVVNTSHFWSLAVEEHFYLLWPAVVWTVPRRRLLAVTLCLIGLALLMRMVVTSLWLAPGDLRVAFQTFTRFDALAMGGAVALLAADVGTARLRRFALAVTGCTAVVLAMTVLAEKGLWLGSPVIQRAGFTVIGLFWTGVCILLITARADSPESRLFTLRPLIFLGKYSYGIYVLHWLLSPVMNRWIHEDAVLALTGSPVGAFLVCLGVKSALSVAAALLSWHALEQPFMNLRGRLPFAHRAITQTI